MSCTIGGETYNTGDYYCDANHNLWQCNGSSWSLVGTGCANGGNPNACGQYQPNMTYAKLHFGCVASDYSSISANLYINDEYMGTGAEVSVCFPEGLYGFVWKLAGYRDSDLRQITVTPEMTHSMVETAYNTLLVPSTTSCPPNADGCPSLGNGIECCGESRTRWKCVNGTWVDQNNDCPPIDTNLCEDITRVQTLIETSPGGVTVTITGTENATVLTGEGTYGERYKCLKPGSYTFVFSRSGYVSQTQSVTLYEYDIWSEVPIEFYASLVASGGETCNRMSDACPAGSPVGFQCCEGTDRMECIKPGSGDPYWTDVGTCGTPSCPTCPSGQHCSGDLTNYLCVPNNQTCPSCPTGQHCSGAITNFACVPNTQSCTPAGAYRCVGNISQRCDGTAGWTQVEVCTGTCSTATGRCTSVLSCPSSCPANQHCSGSMTNYQCVANTQSCPSPCPANQHCSGASTNYQCVPNTTSSTCVNGTTRCKDTNTAQVCTGGAWVDHTCTNGCNSVTGVCNGTSGTVTTCSGMNRNGQFDVTCILEEQNKMLLYGAIGVAALVILMKR